MTNTTLQKLNKLYTFDNIRKNSWSYEISTDTKICQEFLKTIEWISVPQVNYISPVLSDSHNKFHKLLNGLTHYYTDVVHLMPTFYIPALLNKCKISIPVNQHYKHIMEFWKNPLRFNHSSQKIKRQLSFTPVKNFEKKIKLKMQQDKTRLDELYTQTDNLLLQLPITLSAKTVASNNINYVMNGINFYGRVLYCENLTAEKLNSLISIPNKYHLYYIAMGALTPPRPPPPRNPPKPSKSRPSGPGLRGTIAVG